MKLPDGSIHINGIVTEYETSIEYPVGYRETTVTIRESEPQNKLMHKLSRCNPIFKEEKGDKSMSVKIRKQPKEISLEEQVISNLESERIIKEIWKLPTPQNRRVYMYIVDEFSYTKIAKIENRSIPTVKESIDRGLENLRKKLKKFYE